MFSTLCAYIAVLTLLNTIGIETASVPCMLNCTDCCTSPGTAAAHVLKPQAHI